MTANPPPLSREERLAAKLRENLRRRKAQARQLEQGELGQVEPGTAPDPAFPPIPGLSKGSPSS